MSYITEKDFNFFSFLILSFLPASISLSVIFFSISAFSPPSSLVGWLNHPPFQQKPVACLSPCGLLPKSLCRPPPLPSSHSGRITIYPFSTIQLLFNDCFQWRRTVDKLCPTHCDALEQLKENENSMTFWKKATIWSVKCNKIPLCFSLKTYMLANMCATCNFPMKTYSTTSVLDSTDFNLFFLHFFCYIVFFFQEFIS